MIDIDKIIKENCRFGDEGHYRDAIEEVIKQIIPLILQEVSDKAKTTPLYEPNCHDHTPYWGACVTCGRTDNPDVLIGEQVDKESITSLSEELIKKYTE